MCETRSSITDFVNSEMTEASGAQFLDSKSLERLNILHRILKFLGPQHGTFIILPIWHVEFLATPKNFLKFVHPYTFVRIYHYKQYLIFLTPLGCII